ncbi:hypothetical protein C8R43DRAFT_1128067 [Mycena crocata]|nr:hypothetical protein C8R43DRAFT_1128067 [Mycena crocata]
MPHHSKRTHRSQSPPNIAADTGWIPHSHHEPVSGHPSKRPRPGSLSSGDENEDDGDDEEDEEDDDDDGWHVWQGGLADSAPFDRDDDTSSELEVEDAHYHGYDTDSSNGDWHHHVHLQQEEDIEMEDVEAETHDFNDRESLAYDEISDVQMDSQVESDNEGFVPFYADDTGDEASSIGDDTRHDKRSTGRSHNVAKTIEALRKAPEGAPVTKNDLAELLSGYLASQAGPEHSSKSDGQKPGRPTTPKHRGTRTVYLHRLIRETTRHAIGLSSKKDPLTAAHVPSREQVLLFAETKRTKDGPRIPKLKVDVGTKTLASLWNQEAIRLLCKYFLRNIALEKPVKERDLAEMFKVHFQSLRRLYVASTTDLTPTNIQNIRDAKAIMAEKNRLGKLREQRVRAAALYAESDSQLRQLLPVIKSLPKDAMSGDEADHRNGNARYVAKTLAWRASVVDPVMATLDALHLSTRFNPDGSAGRGKFPRARIRKTARPPTPGNPVPGLPQNFYAPAWLSSLPKFELRALKMKPAVDLSFSPAIVR